MLSADNEELLVLGLEQTDTYRKINGHDPELHPTRKGAIERVHKEDEYQVHMEHKYGQECQRDLAHPDGWVIALEPEEGTGRIKKDGINQDEDYEGDAVAVEVLGRGPIMASWVKIAKHIACGGLDGLE